MPDNIKTQPGTGSDPDVRTTEVVGAKHLQHVRADLGRGTAEAQVGGTPLYANGDVAMPTPFVGFYSVAVAFTASATGGTLTFTAAGHSAQRGDSITFLGGGLSANPNLVRTVESVTATTITLSVALPNVVQAGDAFNVTRPVALFCDAGGRVNVNAIATISGTTNINVSQWGGALARTLIDDGAGENPAIVAMCWNPNTSYPDLIYGDAIAGVRTTLRDANGQGCFFFNTTPGTGDYAIPQRPVPGEIHTISDANPTRPASGTPVRNAAITTAVDMLGTTTTRRAVFLTCESGAILWRFGGTTTSTSYTGRLNAGQSLQWTESCPQSNLNVLSVSGTSIAVATEFTG
jgi:hypothetical protein